MPDAITHRQNRKETEMQNAMNSSNIAGSSYMARIKAIARNARAAKAIYKARTKRDSLEDARTKVATKLRRNKAYFNDPTTGDQPDAVYKGIKGVSDDYSAITCRNAPSPTRPTR
jgi:hypothetical protein